MADTPIDPRLTGPDPSQSPPRTQSIMLPIRTLDDLNNVSDGEGNKGREKRLKLNVLKCKQCRDARKKCFPVDRVWPQKCDRCLQHRPDMLECSEPRLISGKRARNLSPEKEKDSTPLPPRPKTQLTPDRQEPQGWESDDDDDGLSDYTGFDRPVRPMARKPMKRGRSESPAPKILLALSVNKENQLGESASRSAEAGTGEDEGPSEVLIPEEKSTDIDADDKTMNRLVSIPTQDGSSLPIKHPQNVQIEDGMRDSNTPSTDFGESAFISGSLEEDLGEVQESLNAFTIQELSTDSGYGSLELRHPTTGAGGHKTAQGQIHIPLPTSIEEEVEEDTQSNMSVDDTASYASSSNDSLVDQEIKETAQALILETIEQDEVLNPLFKDALEQYGRARVVRNLARFLKGYSTLLGREQPTINQKRGVIFLRHRARHFAALICDDLDPSRTALDEALALERAKNSAAERKARLARWISGSALSPSPVRYVPSDDEDGSEPESSVSSDGLPPILEDIRNFLILGEPLRLFRHHFARFAEGESVQEWNNITKRSRGLSVRPPKENLPREEPLLNITSPDPTTHGSITFIPERRSFRVSWRCRCNFEFHSLVPTTDQRIAEDFWRRMNWNVQRDGPMVTRYFKFEWIENLVWAVAPSLLPWFTWELTPNSTEAQDLEANTDLGVQRGLSESSRQPSLGADVDTDVANSRTQITGGSPPIYICLYKRKGGFWRLRHAKVRRQPGVSLFQAQESQPRINGTTTMGSGIELSSVPADTLNGPNMNRELFNTLREKILGTSPSKAISWELNSFIRSWRLWYWPWKWKFKTTWRKSCDWLWRRFDPIAVSGLEFWEFKLNPVPKLVDPVKKDKLPHEEDTSPRDTPCSNVNQKLSSDWEFSPLIGEELIHFKGIISGDTLFHLLKYPDDAHAELPIWTGLPKKIRTKLINQKRIQMPGWGFQVEHEWDSVAFVVRTRPIIIVGFVIAVVLSVTFKWPVSAGVTLALGPVTLVMYINTMLSGITKQKGLSK